MTTATHNPLTEFQWAPQPEAEALVAELVDEFLRRSAFAALVRDRMGAEAGLRFADMVDSVGLPFCYDVERRLKSAGFSRDPERRRVFRHAGGIFPRVSLVSAHEGPIELRLKVESIVDFEAAWAPERARRKLRTGWKPTGEPLAIVRAMTIEVVERSALFRVVERHGSREHPGPELPPAPPAELVVRHREALQIRPRYEDEGWSAASRLIDTAVADLGVDYACDLFFAAEREYWMRRNRAAQVQYARQQRLGFGWANHDHHTYRSSREHFARLVAVWEKLGFVCRERFYAGAEAGWGAQVMEHPVTGIVTFNDVDLSPDELRTDFAHEPLPPRKELGTVGLWCALHGESFLEAGMHHLECTFDFDALKRQLEADHAIKVMKPFTDLPHLRQAFTEGERWPVRPQRIDRLLADGRITPEQAEKFRAEGAIGSHLENLERNAGFKGFNQKGVSEIIAATDPRRQ